MEISTGDVTTLQDLVSQTLEAKGVMPKMKAELRANVFLALEENAGVKEKITSNEDLSAFAKTENGSILLNLIREFLEFFNCDFTVSVFNPESRSGLDYSEMSRTELLNRWKIKESFQRRAPVLCHVVDFGRNSKPPPSADSTASPMGLNSTYTKPGASLETTPVRIELSNIEEQDLEDVSSNISESYSEDSPKSPHKQSLEASLANSHSNVSTPPNEKGNESIDLLVFTPVQQVKTVPKEKRDHEVNKTVRSFQSEHLDLETTPRPNSASRKAADDKEKAAGVESKIEAMKKEGLLASDLMKNIGNGKLNNDKQILDATTNGKKETSRSLSSSLKDLPPLMLAMGGGQRDKSIAEMRKLVDLVDFTDEFQASLSSKKDKESKKGGDDSPASLESERTLNSEQVEEEEEDISEILNSRGSSDGQQTNDETISRFSHRSDVDHVESV